MIEINTDELRVMACLLHAERLETVVEETGMMDKVVIDIMRQLRHYRYVKPVDENGRELSMFDVDKIRGVKFILTSKGYSALENQGGGVIR
jgi:hypothetical protein